MRSFRITRLAAAVSLSFSPLFTQAIGLSDPKSNSYLNRPLTLEFQILSDEPALSPLKVGLADYQTHYRLGIEYPRWLPKLNHEISERNGQFNLTLTTSQPVKEPIVNFVVEMQYQGMTLYKEVTLLLDFPKQLNNAARTNLQTRENTKATIQLESYETSPAKVSNHISGNTYQINRGDSLWKLASYWQGTRLNQSQKMQAIFEENPSAFLNGDKNLLKQGAKIVFPTDANNIDQKSGISTAPQNSRVQTRRFESEISDQSGISLESKNRISDLETSTLQVNRRIQSLTEENKLLSEKLARIESMLSRIDRASENDLKSNLANSLISPQRGAKGSGQTTKPTGLSKLANSAQGKPWENSSALPPRQIQLENPAVGAEKSYGSVTEEGFFTEFFYQISLLGLLILLFISLSGRKLANQWRLNRFNSRLNKQYDHISFEDSRRFTEMPRIKELDIPKQSSNKSQVECIRSATEFYLRCDRFDLAKELVNESLVQYASNSHLVESLLKLRKRLYIQIDHRLQNKIVQKLEHPVGRKKTNQDKIDLLYDEDKIALVDDEFGHLWNQKAS